MPSIVLDKSGIEISSLPDQDFPNIKPGGIGAQVPLANHPGVVTGGLKAFGDGGLRAVESIKGRDAVQVTVLPGEDCGPARRTYRINAEHLIEAHAFVGQSVQIWRTVDLVAIGADC